MDNRSGIDVRWFALISFILGVILVGSVGCSRSEPPPTPDAETSRSADLPSQTTVVATGAGLPQVVAGINAGALNAAGISATVITRDDIPDAVAALERDVADLLIAPIGRLADVVSVNDSESTSASASPTTQPEASNLDETLANLDPALSAQDLTLLAPAQAIDGLVFAVTQARSDSEDLRSLSDLANFSQEQMVQLGAGPGCDSRPSCLPALVDGYAVEIAGVTEAKADKVPALVGDRRVTVGQVQSTDPDIDGLRLAVLQDDRIVSAPQNLVPLISDSVNVPEVADVINQVQEAITTKDLRDFTAALERGNDPYQVADSWVTTRLSS